MKSQPALYCFSLGTLMISIVTAVFTPFCRKRQSRTSNNTQSLDEPRRTIVPCEKRPPEDRVASAIRYWSNERADADMAYVTPPPPSFIPESTLVPEPEGLVETVMIEVPTTDFVRINAGPEPDTAASDTSKSIAEANPFLSEDFHGAPNFYELLQISPRADLETIHRVYRIMAARFHPDNPVSGDHEMFLKLSGAYEVLSDPNRRAQYDFAIQAREKEAIPIFGARIFVDGLDGEMNRRFGILALTYQRRRMNQGSLGISCLELESRMSLPREHLEFTLWYLRQKGYLQIQEDNSDYSISAAGVDYVEANAAQNPFLRELLTPGTVRRTEDAQFEAPHAAHPQQRRLRSRAELRRGRRNGSIVLR